MKKLITVIALALCCALLACCAPAATGQPAQEIEPAEAAPEPAAPEQPAPSEEAAAPVEVDTAKLANILDFSGSVTVTSEGQTLSAYPGMRLLPNDSAKTGSESEAQIELDQERLVILEQDSEISLRQEGDSSLSLLLTSGSVINDIAPGGGGYTLRAGNITMGVLGTIFRVAMKENELIIDLYEGQLTVTAPDTAYAEGYGMGGGERVRIDPDGFATGEAASFEDMSQERLNWLRDKLNERGATEVLAALDEYLEELLATPKPERTAKPSPSPTPSPTPEPTGAVIGFPPAPIVRPPTIGAPASITALNGCGYTYASGTSAWAPDLSFNAVAGQTYRAYILRGGVWQLVSSAIAATTTNGTVALTDVKDGDKVAIVPITANDSSLVPTAQLAALGGTNVYTIVDKTGDIIIINTIYTTYAMNIIGSMAAIPAFVVYDGEGNTGTLTAASSVLNAAAAIAWFEPNANNRCTIQANELWVLGRKAPSPGQP